MTQEATPAQLRSPVIRKGIDCISMKYLSIEIIEGDQPLDITTNTKVLEKFQKAETLGNLTNIACNLHNGLNAVEDVTYALL